MLIKQMKKKLQIGGKGYAGRSMSRNRFCSCNLKWVSISETGFLVGFEFFVFSRMGVVTVAELKPSMSGKRSFRSSSSIRHATEWPISDVASDLVIEVGSSSFALHKFPLVSRSGKIQKLLLEAKDSKTSRVNLSTIPGGPEAFELTAKFCYGINVEITLSNVAMLRCASHYLEMTEEFADRNLETRTETYLKEMVFSNISNSISVLHHCESLLPLSEEINLVSRLINAIASNACKEQLTSGLLKLDHNYPSKTALNIEPETPSDWWGKSLSMLNLDIFQRVLSAVKSKGLKQDMISKILINYAHNSLQGLVIRDHHLVKGSSLNLELQKKHRVIVEPIVSLLPTQSRKSPVPMVFLSSLLKTAITASASTSCRSDLERRMGLQLDQAILEDILIPSITRGSSHSSMYDTDSVVRIFSIFLNLDEDDDNYDCHLRDESETMCDFDNPVSPKQSAILKVSKLLDNYLAEVALDSNLMPSKFIALAELLPDHARVVSDALYRAVDIYLKVHPNIKDSERCRLCKTIDCQKLSQEACSHAAQNERLPVQIAVQVLYFEQIRLRNAMNGSHNQFFFGSSNSSQFPLRSSSGTGSGAISPRDNYASVRRENRELKLEVARMRMRLTDLEKDHVSMKQELVKSHPANKLFKSFTKKLCKLNVLFRMNSIKPFGTKNSSENRFPFQKRRRHSIS
ncbi:BTB/POZ domain-containing protein At1g03010-like isoform X2 [Cucurbita maxima]|uniref:BTB/POZ domain-containing protein At1g03010-like isoform X2 n=1 Tax=Cucurbita maxima TaxID=3661 RepID=A0A6J1JUX8_CUCMA|nr:BTB/POZ domain-containing protein At1g03010-like isoform X2 [Cucurbita maxima]